MWIIVKCNNYDFSLLSTSSAKVWTEKISHGFLHIFPPLLAFYSHEIFTSKLLKVYPIFWSEVNIENENLGKKKNDFKHLHHNYYNIEQWTWYLPIIQTFNWDFVIKKQYASLTAVVLSSRKFLLIE